MANARAFMGKMKDVAVDQPEAASYLFVGAVAGLILIILCLCAAASFLRKRRSRNNEDDDDT